MAHGLHHLRHFERGVVFVGNYAARAIGQAHRGAHVFHAVAQRLFQLFEKWFDFLLFLLVALFLEVFAGTGPIDRLELDVFVLLDAAEHDFVNFIVEDEHFDVFLLVDFEQR